MSYILEKAMFVRTSKGYIPMALVGDTSVVDFEGNVLKLWNCLSLGTHEKFLTEEYIKNYLDQREKEYEDRKKGLLYNLSYADLFGIKAGNGSFNSFKNAILRGIGNSVDYETAVNSLGLWMRFTMPNGNVVSYNLASVNEDEFFGRLSAATGLDHERLSFSFNVHSADRYYDLTNSARKLVSGRGRKSVLGYAIGVSVGDRRNSTSKYVATDGKRMVLVDDKDDAHVFYTEPKKGVDLFDVVRNQFPEIFGMWLVYMGK
ncbi:MAG: hypothetical protein J6Y37_12120 [Paludibacteraceae bacterium]|nr:hypothetical protein [Paludibacteraceae bacterium]